MMKIYIILFVIFGGVILGLTITLWSVQKSREKERLEAEIIQKELLARIVSAEFALSKQNERIEQYLIDTQAKKDIYAKELKRIEDKYSYEKSLVKIDNNSCDDKLSAINEAQKRFCYE